jgi:hypothetical protein
LITLKAVILIVIILNVFVVCNMLKNRLSVIMLSIFILGEHFCAKYRHAGCRRVRFCFSECIMLEAIRLSAIILAVVILNATAPSNLASLMLRYQNLFNILIIF